MYLLTEEQNQIEMLTENTKDGKKLYIEGIFMQANLKNRNGRIYPRPLLEQAVNDYRERYIDKKISMGELEHPDYPIPNPSEAAILIESLTWDGDNVIGKAKVMDSLPKGRILKGLLDEGVLGGVSSRGLGSIREQNGQRIVNEYILNAVDYVMTPSGIDCFPENFYESAPQWINENGVWILNQPEPKKQFDESAFLNNLDKYLENLKKHYK